MDTTALKDSKLSRKAKGLHSYLLSLPDDRKVYLSDLKNRSKDGRDATTSGIDELIAFWYITREESRDDQGHFEYDYTVYERPIDVKDLPDPVTRSGLSDTENPNTENPTVVNNNIGSLYITISIDNNIIDNIYLSSKDYDILLNKYNKESLEKNIISLSKYLKTTRKVYKNHYLTLNKWLSKEKKNGRLAVPVSSDAQKIYDTLKKYNPVVDGSVEDCEKLRLVVVEAYPNNSPVDFVDKLIFAMIKTGQSKFYSIANPSSIAKNLGTIIAKVQTEVAEKPKPTTVSFKDGKMVVS